MMVSRRGTKELRVSCCNLSKSQFQAGFELICDAKHLIRCEFDRDKAVLSHSAFSSTYLLYLIMLYYTMPALSAEQPTATRL
jgi:hypothetical protein